jgi:CRP-like cAMP-binding protein
MKKSKSGSAISANPGGRRTLKALPTSSQVLAGYGVRENYAYCRLVELGISEPTALRVSKDVQMEPFAAGQSIWKKGETVSMWAYVVSGLVVSAIRHKEKMSNTLEIFGESCWFGDYQILNKVVAEADYVCLEASTVLLVPERAVTELMLSEPEFTSFVCRLMAWRAQTRLEFLAAIKMGNPCFRTVAGLWHAALSLTNGFEYRASGITVESVSLPIGQDMLAALCGVSRATFYRYVKHLTAAGWLSRSNRHLVLMNAPAWGRLQQLQRLRQADNYAPTVDELLKDFDSVAGL